MAFLPITDIPGQITIKTRIQEAHTAHMQEIQTKATILRQTAAVFRRQIIWIYSQTAPLAEKHTMMTEDTEEV